jgi:putative addiction module CopG family antidote
MGTVQLTPRAEALLRKKVDDGRYSSIDEALDDAVQLLDARDRLERLRAAIDVADAQIARGEVYELTDELWDEIEREADEANRLGLPIDSNA